MQQCWAVLDVARAHPATVRACRAVVAVRRDHPRLEVAALRALQFAWFTIALPMDDDASIAEALARVEDVDPAAVVARLADDDIEGAYQQDRALARTAQGGPTHFQGKAADTDGAWAAGVPRKMCRSCWPPYPRA